MNANVSHRGATRNVWRLMLWGGLGLLLSLPALAMSLGADGVDWSASDFVIMGGLLAGLGLVIEAVMRVLASWRARWIAVILVVTVFVAIWVELAVGVFGTAFAGS